MDPVRNPFAPGAGTPPPELAGRDQLREKVDVAVRRIAIGKPAKSHLMVGLRGVGKTVLLRRMARDAEAHGYLTLFIEAPEDRSLPSILAPLLRTALLKLSFSGRASEAARRAQRALAGFAKSLRFKYGDLEVGLDAEPEPGLADNGDLESDLADLLETTGRAAQAAESAVVLFLDEAQHVAIDEMGALVMALHRCSQLQLPVTVVGAGLPQLLARLGDAKSYAERLFEFPKVGELDQESASRAIERPIEEEGESIEKEAMDEIYARTHGYPYFLQEWGKHTWDEADASPIALEDVERASIVALATLDESFFRVRFDRVTPRERGYLRAMASLGAGPYRSGEVAARLGKSVNQAGPIRDSLIKKGMIWSKEHGELEFTVPMFDDYMRRTMPELGD